MRKMSPPDLEWLSASFRCEGHPITHSPLLSLLSRRGRIWVPVEGRISPLLPASTSKLFSSMGSGFLMVGTLLSPRKVATGKNVFRWPGGVQGVSDRCATAATLSSLLESCHHRKVHSPVTPPGPLGGIQGAAGISVAAARLPICLKMKWDWFSIDSLFPSQAGERADCQLMSSPKG